MVVFRRFLRAPRLSKAAGIRGRGRTVQPKSNELLRKTFCTAVPFFVSVEVLWSALTRSFFSFPGMFPSHYFALVRDERISFTFFSLCSTPTALFYIHSVACLGQCKLRPPPWRLMTSCAKQTKGGTLSIASTSAINGTTLFSN